MAMSGRVAQGLRRIVDALQRDMFDVADAMPAVPSPAEPSPAEPSPLADRHNDRQVPTEAQKGREALLQGQRIRFALKRTRRRSIGFVVGADGLVVSAPKWLALRDIDAAVQEKSRWIVAKLDEQKHRSAALEATRTVWRDGAEVLYLGLPVRIALGPSSGGAGSMVRLDSAPGDEASAARSMRVLRVGLPLKAAPEQLRDAVQTWLQRQALTLFEARCRHFALLLGVEVKRLSLSSAATRWGSASADGRIRLHWRLIHLSVATIDYVVAHELAHLREMNHSPRFWAVVESVVPGYRQERRGLKRWDTRMLD